MRSNLKMFLILLTLLVIYVAGSVSFLMEKYHQATEQGRVTVRCDTIVRVDSIFIEKPVLRDSIVTRYVTRYLPVAGTGADSQGTVAYSSQARLLETVAETVAVPKSAESATETVIREVVTHSNGGIGLSQDSANVIIPIEQRIYSSDQYTAWVSGYEARLDSIALYTKEVVVDKEIYLDKKRRRWGCVVGAGVGANGNGVTPYVGITVGYVLF